MFLDRRVADTDTEVQVSEYLSPDGCVLHGEPLQPLPQAAAGPHTHPRPRARGRPHHRPAAQGEATEVTGSAMVRPLNSPGEVINN